MANIIGHFLKIAQSDPDEEDYVNVFQVSNPPIERIWGNEDMNTGLDIDQRPDSNYSTICVSETAVSEIYSQTQRKPLILNID